MREERGMRIDDNATAKRIYDRTLGSLGNRIREIYNQGYKAGYEQGVCDVKDELRISFEVLDDIKKWRTWSHTYDNATDRPRGKWIAEEEYGDLWVCDQCGFASEYKDNFCPNCGAKMDGERGEE